MHSHISSVAPALERRKVTDSRGEDWWHVVGPLGAVSFHTYQSDPEFAGVEYHNKTGDRAPDFEHCSVIGGPCWCDGTTLWAVEFVLPLFRECGEQALWDLLEQRYAKYFR